MQRQHQKQRHDGQGQGKKWVFDLENYGEHEDHQRLSEVGEIPTTPLSRLRTDTSSTSRTLTASP